MLLVLGVQATKSHTREFGGIGLGPVLSGRIANWMGGDVNVAGKLGSGSTFMLRVPVRSEGASASETQTADAA